MFLSVFCLDVYNNAVSIFRSTFPSVRWNELTTEQQRQQQLFEIQCSQEIIAIIWLKQTEAGMEEQQKQKFMEKIKEKYQIPDKKFQEIQEFLSKQVSILEDLASVVESSSLPLSPSDTISTNSSNSSAGLTGTKKKSSLVSMVS